MANYDYSEEYACDDVYGPNPKWAIEPNEGEECAPDEYYLRLHNHGYVINAREDRVSYRLWENVAKAIEEGSYAEMTLEYWNGCSMCYTTIAFDHAVCILKTKGKTIPLNQDDVNALVRVFRESATIWRLIEEREVQPELPKQVSPALELPLSAFPAARLVPHDVGWKLEIYEGWQDLPRYILLGNKEIEDLASPEDGYMLDVWADDSRYPGYKYEARAHTVTRQGNALVLRSDHDHSRSPVDPKFSTVVSVAVEYLYRGELADVDGRWFTC